LASLAVLKAALVSILMAFPPAVSDREETHDARATRMSALAGEIAEASLGARWRGNRLDLAALLVTIAWHETRIASTFQRTDKRGMGGAQGLWQIEPGAHSKGDPRLASTAAEHLSRSWQCGAGPRGWLTAYAGVPKCAHWAGITARVRTFYWVRGKL
jgi:hypothetical protein